MSSSSRSAALWIVAGAAGFAIVGGLTRWLRADVDWRVIVFARASVGLAVAIVLLRATRTRMPFPGPSQLWLRSLAGGLSILCAFYAASRLSVADTTVLVNSSPLWLAALSVFFLRHRLALSVWLVLLLGTIGVVMITQPHFVHRNIGAAAGAATGLLGAVGYLAISRMRHVGTAAIVVHSNAAGVVSSAFVLGASTASIDSRFVHSPLTMLLLVLVGVAGAFSQFAITRGYSRGQPARVAPMQYASVAFATVIDIAVFHDIPSLMTFVGIAFVVGSAIWILRHQDMLDVRTVRVPHTHGVDLARLPELEDAIKHAESLTSCEVRVHIERHCSDHSARPREIFEMLGMKRTRRRNAVLIYLASESRVFAVVVDEGIEDLVPRSIIDAACNEVSIALETMDLISTTSHGIVAILGTLGRWFPVEDGDHNELSDSISLLP